jgi:hypothetical protein
MTMPRRFLVLAVALLVTAIELPARAAGAREAVVARTLTGEVGRRLTVSAPASTKLSDALTTTIVFVYEDRRPIERAKLLGTAFVVGLPVHGQPGQFVPIVVTAKHVVADRARIVGRYTSVSGPGPVFVEYDLAQLRANGDLWVHPDEGIDLVVFRTPVFDSVKSSIIPLDRIASREVFARESIDVMDRVMLPSLMEAFTGATRNYPIFRDGSVAMLAEEQMPLEWFLGPRRIRTMQQLMLINSTVNEGFSGAPVFLWPASGPQSRATGPARAPWLLGVVHGYFHKNRKVIDAQGDPVFLTHKEASAGGEPEAGAGGEMFVRENSAIGIVFPSWRLREILESDAVTARIGEVLGGERSPVARQRAQRP